MKAYTDLEQSKKLAEILPIESADMVSPFQHTKNDEYIPGYVVSRNYVEVHNEMMKLPAMEKEDICKLIQPSWSLAALLDVLPFPQLSKDKLGSGKEGWMVSAYPDNCRYDSCWHDNPVDACYEMILKLHKQKLL